MSTRRASMRYRDSNPGTRQRGVVLPLVAVSLVVLVGVAGLALDLGHGYLNRTRLQNALDAAALSGAKTLDQTGGNTALATAAAIAAFNQNVAGAGNSELGGIAFGAGNITYSATLNPFNAGSNPPTFVRAGVAALTRPSWFSQVIGQPNVTVAGSAVAGPSPMECARIVPVVLCATEPPPTGTYHGYTIGQVYPIKVSQQNTDIGAGNYQNINLPDCGTGADCIRENWAGAFNQCVGTGDTVTTKPGKSVGPNAQGMNTRFNDYSGAAKNKLDPAQYPPDVVTKYTKYPNVSYNFDAYNTDTETGNWDPAAVANHGVTYRRMVNVPIAVCPDPTTAKGGGTLDLTVLDIGCFFLTQPVDQNGQQTIYGEFRRTCQGYGTASPTAVLGPGPRTIILYKDFTAVDS